jgi:hypothetical protein
MEQHVWALGLTQYGQKQCSLHCLVDSLKRLLHTPPIEITTKRSSYTAGLARPCLKA